MGQHDELLLAATVNTHSERLRQSFLDRLESAAPLLPDTDPLSELT